MVNYILDGHTPKPEPDLSKWGKWFETTERHVADTVIDDLRVSTVFLGIDHGWNERKPILFETAIFQNGEVIDMARYATWEEAEKGHNNMCAELKTKLELASLYTSDCIAKITVR